MRLPADPRPGVAVDVGKLGSPLDTAAVDLLSRAVIGFEPDAKGAFDQHTRVGGADRKAGRATASELDFLPLVLIGALLDCPAAKVPATRHAAKATPTCLMCISLQF